MEFESASQDHSYYGQEDQQQYFFIVQSKL